MYQVPPYHHVADGVIEALIHANPLATIMVNGIHAPVCSLIPLLADFQPTGCRLRGHVFKHTDHYEAMQSASAITALFQGPNAPISARWYPDPARAGTWNYVAVSCHGTFRWLNDNETIQQLADLTNRQEAADSPARFECIPVDYVSGLLPLIAGFEINVQQFQPVFKLSQDKGPEIQRNIVTKLRGQTDYRAQALAQYIEISLNAPDDDPPTY